MINNKDFLWALAEFFMLDVDIFLSHSRLGRVLGEHTRDGLDSHIVVDITRGEYTNVKTLAHELIHELQFQRELKEPYDIEEVIGSGELTGEDYFNFPREVEAYQCDSGYVEDIVNEYCRYGKTYCKHLKEQAMADKQDLDSTNSVFVNV